MPRALGVLTPYLERARALGAVDAKVIGPQGVLCAQWVRLKCQYGCDGFGSSHCCPPHSPTPEQTRRVIDEYHRLLLVHCRRWVDVDKVVVALEREIFLDGHYQAFAWGAGPCRLCRTCDPAQPCRHSERARPSMEASGIDVFATARRAGFPIQVVRSRRDHDHYYGLVGID